MFFFQRRHFDGGRDLKGSKWVFRFRWTLSSVHIKWNPDWWGNRQTSSFCLDIGDFLGIHPCGHVSTKCLDWFKICALALMHNHLIVHTFLPLLSLFLSHLVVRVPLQHGQQLYRHIYLGCKEDDNVHKNFELLFTTLAVLTIELANEEVVIDLIRLAIALQVTLPLTYSSVSCDQVAFYYTFCCMRVTSQAVKVWREKEEAAKFN